MIVIIEHYKISCDCEGKQYLGMDLDWDYDNRKVQLYMLGYVPDTITRFKHKHPRKPQHQPYPKIKPMYSAKAQYEENADMSPTLSKKDKNCTVSHGYLLVSHKGS